MLTELNSAQAQKEGINVSTTYSVYNIPYQQGVNAVLRKYAGLVGDVGNVATNVRNEMFGHPVEAYKQFRQGTLFKPGTGLYHQGLPRTPGSIAATFALPAAMTMLMAKLNPEVGRGELAGSMAGNVAGSLLGGPLAGSVGRVGGGMLLAPVGQALGRQFDTATAPHSIKDVAEE